MSEGKEVYLTVSQLATAAGADRTEARKFLDVWTQLCTSELNAGRPFAIENIGRLMPRKTMRTNTQNPRTNTNIGTRLVKRVAITTYKTLYDALN